MGPHDKKKKMQDMAIKLNVFTFSELKTWLLFFPSNLGETLSREERDQAFRIYEMTSGKKLIVVLPQSQRRVPGRVWCLA